MKETTVLSFYPALEAGYEPRNYSYLKDDVPVGEYQARLDFMIWSKKQMAINCFFTLPATGQQISLSAYRNNDGQYMAGETEMRFISFGTLFLVEVELNGQGNPKVKKIKMLETGSNE